MKMIRSFAVLALFLSGVVNSGCTTAGTEVIENQDRSLAELQALVVAALPAGKHSVSQNGRTYTSNYFVAEKGEFVEALDTPTRNKAVIVILGDRRPYNLEVNVVHEKKNSSSEYVSTGNDEGLARVVIRRIQKALHERRDNRNIIDDFRIF